VDWPRNAIDVFVLAALEARGWEPAPEADSAVLARRLSLDLAGLPLEGHVAAAYLQDSSSAAADRLADRLLASPRYGERMAVAWLDAARYADSHGYHMDAHRDMWRWRDWVIDALNRGINSPSSSWRAIFSHRPRYPSEWQRHSTAIT
jgi:hypothetical protein